MVRRKIISAWKGEMVLLEMSVFRGVVLACVGKTGVLVCVEKMGMAFVACGLGEGASWTAARTRRCRSEAISAFMAAREAMEGAVELVMVGILWVWGLWGGVAPFYVDVAVAVGCYCCCCVVGFWISDAFLAKSAEELQVKMKIFGCKGK